MFRFLRLFFTRIFEYQNLITRNPIFLEQVEGVGIISGEEAMNWGLAGPTLRASRISWHLHTAAQYECHTQFLYWEVQRQKEGDFVSTCFHEDRMDCGPRDRHLCLGLRRVRCGHVTCKRRTPRDFSPTQEKKKERARLNRAVNSPIKCLSHLYFQYTWRPTGRPRGPVRMASLATRQQRLRLVRATWALPHGLSAVSRQRHVSAHLATSAPTGKYLPFFVNF